MDKKFDPDQESNKYVLDESLSSSVHAIDPLEDSPIEEVRSAVPPTDDPTIPTATFRAWFWGIIFSCAISFSNQVKYLCVIELINITNTYLFSFSGFVLIL